MNCSRAQQLLSPYIDQQLTGVEMLEIQQHLSECVGCAEEYQSAQQVKDLLRSLSFPRAESSLESRILSRLAQEERRSETFLPALSPFSALPALRQAAPALSISLPLPSRRRRLTVAFALSCITVFVVAAPFAPSTPSDPVAADRAALGQAALLEPIPNAGLRAAPAYGDPWTRPVSVSADDLSAGSAQLSRQGVVAVRRDVQPSLADVGAEPLGDAAASGYVSGDVAFVGYRVR